MLILSRAWRIENRIGRPEQDEHELVPLRTAGFDPFAGG